MRIGSLFAGIGTADLAVEHALGARPAWQLDVVGAAVRRRHWPGALQVEADVRGVDPAALPLVDVLVAGFPCQDLSVAGTGAGLEGARSGLYREVLRFLGADPEVLYPSAGTPSVVRLARTARQPAYVVLENVPGLLRYMPKLQEEFGALGYGLTWTTARALDAGHPHLRRRVFVLGALGEIGRGFVGVTPAGETDEAPWATPSAANPNEGVDPASWGARRARTTATSRPISEPLAQQVVPWATPKTTDARSLPGSKAHSGTSLTDAVREDRATADRPWPTPATRDYRVGSGLDRVGTPPLSDAAAPTGGRGRRLNPDWIEALMGLPVGWTLPNGAPRVYDPHAPAVRGRYPANWDRTQVWPGYDWEPPRTLPDGPPVRGRAERIRALGNAWCPQQGALALTHLLLGGRY